MISSWKKRKGMLLVSFRHKSNVKMNLLRLFKFQNKVSELPAGPEPPFFTENLFSLMAAAAVDRKPENSSFGDVLEQVYSTYRQVRNRFTQSKTGRNQVHIVYRQVGSRCTTTT